MSLLCYLYQTGIWFSIFKPQYLCFGVRMYKVLLCHTHSLQSLGSIKLVIFKIFMIGFSIEIVLNNEEIACFIKF